MRLKLLITDLDNTLYDWVTFFAVSFGEMLSSLCQLTGAPRERLESEFKAVHQRYGNSEHPFAALELPSVIDAAGTSDRARIAEFVAEPLRVFNDSRRRTLRLYPGVREALQRLDRLQVPIVGHTEAMVLNSYYRLVSLGIEDSFRHLYCVQGHVPTHPNATRPRQLRPPPGYVREFPATERKPSPAVILDICASERVRPSECAYIGDSIARDVMMAKQAGTLAVWARYGTEYEPSHWRQLVAVTHWTDDDVRRETELRERSAKVRADVTVDRFDEICALFDSAGAAAPDA